MRGAGGVGGGGGGGGVAGGSTVDQSRRLPPTHPHGTLTTPRPLPSPSAAATLLMTRVAAVGPGEWMMPVSLGGGINHIHSRAGFSSSGT